MSSSPDLGKVQSDRALFKLIAELGGFDVSTGLDILDRMSSVMIMRSQNNVRFEMLQDLNSFVIAIEIDTLAHSSDFQMKYDRS